MLRIAVAGNLWDLWKRHSTACSDPINSFSDPVFFGSGSNFFSWVRIRIEQTSGSGSTERTSKICKYKYKNIYFIPIKHFSHCPFWLDPAKSNKKHHLDPISLLMNGSWSGFLKSGSGSSAKKPRSIRIRIRNTACIKAWAQHMTNDTAICVDGVRSGWLLGSIPVSSNMNCQGTIKPIIW